MNLQFDLTVQLQTIDGCNARCYKCPASYIYHSYQMMSDYVFEKIVYEVSLLSKKPRFSMYLQNEPLMDNLLFKRVKFIKEIIPQAVFEISTNCLLLPKYYKEIAYFFDIIVLSIQGWDAESYNLIHRTNISAHHFNEILKAARYLQNNKKYVFLKQFKASILENHKKKDVDKWYKMPYSRGGFLNNNKILKDKLKGCAGNKHKFINVLHDGSLILCCMDYLRETIYGNIKYQTLKEIFDSQLYKAYIDRVEGRIETEKEFICKKCELAL